MNNSVFWSSLHDKFMALKGEEDAQEGPMDYLHVLATYDKTPLGQWTLSGGPSANFKLRFELAGTEAGVRLGPPPETRPLHYWLHHLLIYLRQNNSKHLRITSEDGGGVIEYLCEASATYCAHLQILAIEAPLYPQVEINAFVEERPLKLLPLLSPDDPQNKLSPEARHRVIDARLDAEKLQWEAEAQIQTDHLDTHGISAERLRNKANFKSAKTVLQVLRDEFQSAGFSEAELRRAMDNEIEAAVNSLDLNGSQKHVLTLEFAISRSRPKKATEKTQADTSHGIPANTITKKSMENSRAERFTLRDQYFAAFPEKIKVLDVCWAAGEHYREWKRWLQRPSPIKDGTKPDRAFRGILTSGKRPLEYRPLERPSEWQ